MRLLSKIGFPVVLTLYLLTIGAVVFVAAGGLGYLLK